ncbi:MAG: RNA polymerase factor sigma-54 [Treponema sp.]|jgi:RNA polymerase sigma-54 factor|nr:RNA polymerase factor sigma-54 [Treponema sp.]
MQMQRPSFFQEQRLKMNPRLYQSIKLMELPVMDLREKIGEELERNPALEMLEDRGTVSLDDAVTPPREEDDYFEATSDSGFVRQGGQAASDEQRRFIEGVLSRPETLQQHLLWQLQLESADDELRAIAEILIQNLDHDGFHKEPPETLFRQNGTFPIAPPPRLDEAIKLVQGLDPAGCCTANYHESLEVQIGLMTDRPEGIEKALDCLEQLEREKFADAAKQTGCSEEALRGCFERIKELSPFPGRRFAPAETRYVVPDIQVIRSEGEFVIILNEEAIPVLGINPFFMKIAHGVRKNSSGRAAGNRHGTGESQSRDFALENIKEARWFIQSVNQRNHTLLRVARAIVEFQRPFFENGPKYLSPLTLGDIAGELGVHETTVSRTANGKYMQTEYGIFELRHFFTNSISGAGSGGSRFSKEGVKAVIQELVSGEDRSLSDQEISDMLALRGISLARRTVAKYRKELDLGSSYTR